MICIQCGAAVSRPCIFLSDARLPATASLSPKTRLVLVQQAFRSCCALLKEGVSSDTCTRLRLQP